MRATIFRAIALGILASVSLLSAGCGDDDPAAICGGCVDEFGKCLEGESKNACGKNGESCNKCDSDESCIKQECSGEACGPDNCDGCCKGGDCNEDGDTSAACGTNGKTCDRCTTTESCDADTHKCVAKECDKDSCPKGCCFNQKCQTEDNEDYCGIGGEACEPCKTGQKCVDQECEVFDCNATSCALGCCDSRGICQDDQRNGACGLGGRGCIACGDGLACDKSTGSCQPAANLCNSTNCGGGCCDDEGVCQVGTKPEACGLAGTKCENCGPGGDCDNNQCKCVEGGNCDGCCEGNVCKPGSDDAFCGSGGQDCEKCTSPNHCDSDKTCSESCGFPNCPGCCNGDTCKSTSDSNDCGRWGGSCSDCGSDSCYDGVCNDDNTCPECSGCCKNGSCQSGNSDDACGHTSEVCEICAPNMECDNGNCVIKPSSNWNVYLERIVVKEPPPDTPWDSAPGYEAPDVFIVFKVGSQTATGDENEDQFDNTYDQYLLTATASALMGTVQVEVRDADLFGSELIGSCTWSTSYSNYIAEWDLENGRFEAYGCGSNVSSIVLRFTPSI